MSGYTMTQSELLFSQDVAGTVTGTGVTTIQNAAIGYAPLVVPGGYFSNAASSTRTSSIKLVWGGLLIATATVPTFTFSLGYTQTDSYSGAAVLAASAALIPTATTGTWFEVTMHLAPRTLPVGTSTTPTLATISAHGFADIAYGTSQPMKWPIPAAAATYSPAATLDTSVQQWLWPSLTLGTATAGNTVTTEYIKLYGEN